MTSFPRKLTIEDGDLVSRDLIGRDPIPVLVELPAAALTNVNGDQLPTEDPAVAGALWVDPDAEFVVKVSQG